jgi:hypothetical protein
MFIIKLGKIATNVGTALKAPQIVPGGLGAKAQTWGGQTITSAPQAKNVPKPSFIQGVQNQLRSVIQNLFGRLRSSW